MKKYLFGVIACWCIFMFSFDTKVFAADELSSNVENEFSLKTILSIEQVSTSVDGRICISAMVTVQDSYSQIIGLSNVELDSYYTDNVDGSSIIISNPTIWNSGSYATVTVTYKYKKVVTSTVCYFYP